LPAVRATSCCHSRKTIASTISTRHFWRPRLKNIASASPSTISSASCKPFPASRKALKLLIQNTPVPESNSTTRGAGSNSSSLSKALLGHGSVDPIFGRSPRIYCRGMPLLPIGDSDEFQNCYGAAFAAATIRISHEGAKTIGA
jgi:hypothetical protein